MDIKELRYRVENNGKGGIDLEEIHELLDRLEAAEKAVTEAYQRGYATGQEEIEKERDALRAKIEQMERQEPVAEIGQQYSLLFAGSGSITGLVKRHGLKVGSKLYALPGAKGEDK